MATICKRYRLQQNITSIYVIDLKIIKFSGTWKCK